PPRTRRAGVLGAARLSQSRRSVARAAVPGRSLTMTDTQVVAAPPRLEWRVATVSSVRDETPHAKTIVLDVPEWRGHRAGQHVDVRLLAEDGYEAQRSYSIASPPESTSVELTVERIENAEVSPYLCDVLRAGDGLEMRGPIGGYFVWSAMQHAPLLLVAGGSG